MRNVELYKHPSSNICEMFELRWMRLLKYVALVVKMWATYKQNTAQSF